MVDENEQNVKVCHVTYFRNKVIGKGKKWNYLLNFLFCLIIFYTISQILSKIRLISFFLLLISVNISFTYSFTKFIFFLRLKLYFFLSISTGLKNE